MIEPNIRVEMQVVDGSAVDGTTAATAWVRTSLHLGEIWAVRQWYEFEHAEAREDACLIDHHDGSTQRIRLPFDEMAERVEEWRRHAALFGIVG